MKTFKIFSGPHFEHVTKDLSNTLKSGIGDAFLDSLDPTESEHFVESLISKYRIEPLVLTFEAVVISDQESDIPAQSFPPGFAVEDGGVYRRSVIRYHVPFQGDEFLLQCKPNPCAMNTFDAFVEDGRLCFAIVVFHSSEPQSISDTAGRRLKLMRGQYDSLAIQVESFNRGLPGMVRALCDLNLRPGIWRAGEPFWGLLAIRCEKRMNAYQMPGVERRINAKLRGWGNYFCYGTLARAYQIANNHVEKRVRNSLRRRHRHSTKGTRRFSSGEIFGGMGVYRLARG